MPLSKELLGNAIYNIRKRYSAKTVPQLVSKYGSLEKAQLQMAVDEADAIISHFKINGVVEVAVQTTVATTGTALAQTGTGAGTGVGTIK